jgi:KDO2-lipid IV(A) lauroyltransferase
MIFATFRFVLIFLFRLLGLLCFYFAGKRKKVTIKNLGLCFPVKNKQDKKRNIHIARRCFMSLGHGFADFFLIRFYSQKDVKKYIQVEGFEHFKEALDYKKGIIMSTAHFGSWELASKVLSLYGLRSLILYNPIKKPQWVENFVKNNRESTGNRLISKYNGLLPIFKHVKRGGIVTFVADQHCAKEEGRLIPFFKNKVWTHTSLVKLSLKTGAPIIPGFIFNDGFFEYHVKIFKPLYPQNFYKYDDPEYEMACVNNKILETVIEKKPELWMWQHRRFKNLY